MGSVVQHALEAPAGVDPVRVDRQAGSLRGKRLALDDSPSSWRTTSIRSAESPRSRMPKPGSRPTARAYSRSSRAPIAWNVPAQGRRTAAAGDAARRFSDSAWATSRSARRVISVAARRLKVNSRMRAGSMPESTRWATRCASVPVLPVPAPAITSSGPDSNRPVSPGAPQAAASRCRGLSRASHGASLTAASLTPVRVAAASVTAQTRWPRPAATGGPGGTGARPRGP